MSKIMHALRNAMLGSTATLLALEWAGTASLTGEIGMAFTLAILLTVYTSFDQLRNEIRAKFWGLSPWETNE